LFIQDNFVEFFHGYLKEMTLTPDNFLPKVILLQSALPRFVLLCSLVALLTFLMFAFESFA